LRIYKAYHHDIITIYTLGSRGDYNVRTKNKKKNRAKTTLR